VFNAIEAACLTPFSGPGILGATGLTYALTEMLGSLNILSCILVAVDGFRAG
jgi:hypothetical protein